MLKDTRWAARWWLDQDPSIGTPMKFTNFSCGLFTDACSMVFGAHLEGTMLLWEPQEQQFHTNLLEMTAVAKALLEFFLQGTTVLVSSDNSTVVSYINRMRTCCLSFWKEMKLFSQQVINFRISLSAVHIPGKMNVLADLLLSQDQTLPADMLLNQEIMRHLFHLWGSPHAMCISSPPGGTPSS